MKAKVTIAVGSNINPDHNIPKALTLLSKQVAITHISKVYKTPPVGLLDQADFYNLCIRCETTLEPLEIKTRILRSIESECGRIRTSEPNSPRTIDLDIILYNCDIISENGFVLPDPDICRFAHIAVPLADIAADERHPVTSQTFSEISTPFKKQFQGLQVDLNLNQLLI